MNYLFSPFMSLYNHVLHAFFSLRSTGVHPRWKRPQEVFFFSFFGKNLVRERR